MDGKSEGTKPEEDNRRGFGDDFVGADDGACGKRSITHSNVARVIIRRQQALKGFKLLVMTPVNADNSVSKV